MRAPHDNSTPSQSQQLANTWALGVLGVVYGDFRRKVTPWAYQHLRGLAAMHFATGVVLAGVGAELISHGFPQWATLALAGMALHFAIGCADITVARSTFARSAPSRA